MTRKIFIFCIFSMLLYEPAYAGRPFSTEDATVAGKGAIQQEVGIEPVWQEKRDKKYTFSSASIYGLRDGMEFSVEAPYAIIEPKEGNKESGFDDMTLVLKTVLFPERDDMPQFLLKTTLKLANGDEDRGLGSGDEDIGLSIAATKNTGPATLHANLGYVFTGDKFDNTLHDYLLYGLAGEYSLNPRLSIVSEIYGETSSHHDTSAFKHYVLNPLLGLTYGVTETILFDIAFKLGIEDDKEPERGIITGLSLSF